MYLMIGNQCILIMDKTIEFSSLVLPTPSPYCIACTATIAIIIVLVVILIIIK